MSCELSKYVKYEQSLAPVASATANNTGAKIDSAGYDGVMFVAHVGTVAAGPVTLKIQGAATTSDTFQDLASATVTSTTGADDGPLVVNVHKPLQDFRWMQPVLNHSGAAEIGGIMAYKYGPSKVPITQSTTTAVNGLASVVSPGT